MKNSICYVSLIFTLVTSVVLGNEELKTPYSLKKNALAAISEVFTKLDSVIPKLTPAEEEWVEEENLAIYKRQSEGARFSSFVSSREYSINLIRLKISEVTDTLQLIKLAQQEANSAKEVLGWTLLVYALRDNDRLEIEFSNIAAKGIITKNDFNKDMGFNWLTGEQSGQVQLLWGQQADLIWKSFVKKDLVRELKPQLVK
jgi:hypothetical protein